jgi:CheY-like chemotaxis protein
MAERPLVLVVEDEYLLQADVLDALSKAGYEADGVYSGEQALEAFANRPYKVLITDARLGGDLTGWDVALRGVPTPRGGDTWNAMTAMRVLKRLRLRQ